MSRKKPFIAKRFFSDLSFLPFWKEAAKYKLSYFKKDLFSSFSIALLAIPQSIAYSLLAGLPPSAGLYSAIFASIFTGTFGSSKHLVSGPSTGVSILIQTSIAQAINTFYPNALGYEKETLVMHILLQIVLCIGIVQILAGLCNFGRLLQFVSRSVILGYFAGVGIAILFSQLYFLIGIKESYQSTLVFTKAFYLFKNISSIKFLTTSIGIVSFSMLLFLKYKFKKIPYALIMIFITTVFVFWLSFYDISSIETIGSIASFENFSFKLSIPYFDIALIKEIYPSILAISLLSLLEVYSISRGIAAKSGQKIYSNQEVFAVGISNAFLSFLHGAMPASGSLSRSLLNFDNRAKTRFSAVMSGIIVAIVIIFCWPLVEYIPLCALAALLISMVVGLVNKEELRICFKASKGDSIAFSLTVLACIFFSLDIAFFLGIIIAIIFYLIKAAKPHLEEYEFNNSGRLLVIDVEKIKHRKIRIVGVAGGLFFGSVDIFQKTLQSVAKDPYIKIIVLRLNQIYYVDASMCFALLTLHEHLSATNRHLIISGITDDVWAVFKRCSIIEKIGEDKLFLTNESNPQLSTWRAFQRAEELLVKKS
jgi:sulfate permease, SulP family